MQYDWEGAGRRPVQALLRASTPRPSCVTSGNRPLGMPRQAAHNRTMSWPSRVGLSLAVLVGGSALVTTAFAAAIGHHEALHAQLCHEVHHLAAAEPLFRATLTFIGFDPA